MDSVITYGNTRNKSDISSRPFVTRKPRFMPLLKANYHIMTSHSTYAFSTRHTTKQVPFLSHPGPFCDLEKLRGNYGHIYSIDTKNVSGIK
jgi:hypothetical protein